MMMEGDKGKDKKIKEEGRREAGGERERREEE